MQSPTLKVPQETSYVADIAKDDRSVEGLSAVQDEVTAVVAVVHIALHCKLWSDSHVQSSVPTQTLPRGDLWSHTSTSCSRGVCSTLL